MSRPESPTSILDQRAASAAERLWLVTNKDGSREITDEANKAGRGGFAPAYGQTYRDVLNDMIRSINGETETWVRIAARVARGIHPVEKQFSKQTSPGVYFIAGSTAYLAYTGTHHTGHFIGFGGRRYRITLNSGEVVESNNVWFLRTVPPYLRETLKDTATMEAM